ncbi:MAG TPA: hypothetical protein VLH09_06990, partial [Bryobacteraceae bacterium]|nr:hypothetical protein [Bryobacteraceae bacterium]
AFSVDVTSRGVAEPKITLRAPQGTVAVHGMGDLSFSSLAGNINLRAGKSIVAAAQNFLSFIYGAFTVNNTFTVRQGMVDAVVLKARQLISNVVMSRKMTVPTHEGMNHVIAIPVGEEADAKYVPQNFGAHDGDNTEEVSTARDLASYTGPDAPATDVAGNARPGFDVRPAHLAPETVTQQRLRFDAPGTHATWNWVSDALAGALASPAAYPWPGTTPQDLKAMGGEDLHAPSATDYKTLANSATDLQKSAKQFRFLTTVAL